MLFIFRAVFHGKNGPQVRAALGLVLLAVGLAAHLGSGVVAVGVVLVVWGLCAWFTTQRSHRRADR